MFKNTMLRYYMRSCNSLRHQSLYCWTRSFQTDSFMRMVKPSPSRPFLHERYLSRTSIVSLPPTELGSCHSRRIHDLSHLNQSNAIHHNIATNNSSGIITTKRYIQSEREYITIVTNTLQTMHDTIDNVLDQQTFITDYEISFSQGVLTLKFPPHGTWVINQQTPNLQIWWSSPLSGPKRFEYDDNDKLWFSTKDGLNLGHALSQEIHHIYPDLDPIELNL